jgi:hypothetical protein
MRRSLSITTVGLSLSAPLAVLYVVVMLASMLYVGLRTTGSWQAAFLGAAWPTVAGLDIGLAAIVASGYVIATVFVLAYNSISRLVLVRPGKPERAGRTVWSWARSWQVRLLAACLVLPPLALLGLRVLVSAGSPETYISGFGARVQPSNLGSTFNTAYRETEPSFTADGQTMYFNCFNGDICISHLIGTWEEGSWTTPERLGAPISTEYLEVEPVINAAGDQLYFTSIRPIGRLKGLPFLSPFMGFFRMVNTLSTARLNRSFFGGLGLQDVYVSYLIDGAWSEPESLNEASGEPPINTSFADHCLFFSADGNEAFWTSTRPGGSGKDDIWTSRRVNGQWTEAENLGPNVNGPESEHTSIPTPDGQSLYVTATRAEGFGDEDIYVTRRGSNSAWGPLANLGPLVNGPGDDRCPAWTPDLKIFLFDSVREGGFGSRDIWWVYYEDVMGKPLAAASTGAPH